MPLFETVINTNVNALSAKTGESFNIYLDDLNMTVDALLGLIDNSGVQFGVDASAQLTAFTNISAAELKKLLIVTVDSNDVNDIDSATDISFVAPKTSNLLVLETQCSAFDAAFVSKNLEIGAIGGMSPTTAGEDFARYLSAKLFNTYQAVDLFSNESVIADSVDVTAGELYTKLNTNSTNIASKIFNHIIAQDTNNSRLYDMSGEWQQGSSTDLTDATLSVNSVVGSVPIQAGDSLIFHVTVNADPNQHDLTGVAPIGPRVYRVVLQLSN